MSATHIPAGYGGCTPYLIFDDTARAIAFYKEALHAREVFRLVNQRRGGIRHAEIVIEGTPLMLADANAEQGAHSPAQLGGSPVFFYLYVKEIEASHARALRAGMVEVCPVTEMFWGDAMSVLRDPFGYQWTLAQRLRTVPDDEMQRAATAEGLEMKGRCDA